VLAAAPAGALRVLVVHHNVLRGDLSRRMGLARWRTAQARLAASGAELILCGHDHQENVGLLGSGVVVATAGTHASRSRGGRPSAFNLIEADGATITVRHHHWDAGTGRFTPAPRQVFRRGGRAEIGDPEPAPVAGGG
jgi:hypothetical protein